MSWSYDYKNRLPMNHFAFCDGQGICRFPIFDIDGHLDPTHLRNALSRLPITELPDERCRIRIRKALEKLLIRMNAGEHITADEWTPITTKSLFANPSEDKMAVYRLTVVKTMEIGIEAPNKKAALLWYQENWDGDDTFFDCETELEGISQDEEYQPQIRVNKDGVITRRPR